MIRFQSLLILLQVGCLLDSVLSLDPVHECKIRVKGYTGGDSDKSGFIEVDNIVVKRFSETSSDPNKNGFHVVTIDWLCQAVDIQSFPLDAKSPFNIIDPDGLMDYFMNTKHGQVMIVATGQKVDTAIKGLLKQVLTAVGVQISSSITQNDALVFVARRGYPHETIQRVIPDALGPQPALAVVVTQWKWYTNQFSSDCFPSLPTPGQLTAYTSKDLHHFPKLAFRCNGYIIGWEYVLGEKPEDIIVSVWNIYNNQLGTHYLHLADLDPFQYGRYFINHEYFDSYVTFGQTRMYTANGYSIGFHYPSASSAGQALLLWGDSRQTYWDQSHLGQSYFDAVRSGRTYSNKYSAPVSFRGTTPDGYVRGLPSLRPIMSTSPYVARVRDLTSDPAGSQRILSLNYYATQNVGSIDAETLYIFQTSLKFDGYVIGIEYYRAGAGEFYFATYNSKFELIMNSATTISVAKPGETYVRIPESQKLDVRPGDFLAIGFPTGMTSPIPIAAAKNAAATRAVWTVAVSGLNAHSALPATIVGKTAATISQLAFRLFYYARTALDDGQFPKVVPQNPFEIANCYVDSNCYSRDTNLRCILRKCKCRYGMTYDYFHQTCIWDGNFAYVGWTYYLGSLTENPSSSTRWKLIDGITESGFNTIFADTSCYFLPNLMKPWVVVRLGGEVDVSVVEITPFDIREFDSYIEIYDKTFSGIQYVIRADEITNPSKYLSMASFLPKQIDSVKVHGPEAWWLVDTDTDSCTSFSESTWITLTRGSYNSEQLGAVGAKKKKVPTATLR